MRSRALLFTRLTDKEASLAGIEIAPTTHKRGCARYLRMCGRQLTERVKVCKVAKEKPREPRIWVLGTSRREISLLSLRNPSVHHIQKSPCISHEPVIRPTSECSQPQISPLAAASPRSYMVDPRVWTAKHRALASTTRARQGSCEMLVENFKKWRSPRFGKCGYTRLTVDADHQPRHPFRRLYEYLLLWIWR